jgi:hypothetical protein
MTVALPGCTGSGVDALDIAAPLPPPPSAQTAVPATEQALPVLAEPGTIAVGAVPAVPPGQAPAVAAPAPAPPAPVASRVLRSGYPTLNSVPSGAIAQMTPAEEIAMLTRLNAELGSRAALSPGEKAAFEQRRLRLLELARTNAASVQSQIEAR